MTRFKGFSFPKDAALEDTIAQAAIALKNKFIQVDYRKLPLSDYGKKYYAYDLRKLDYMLRSYAIMLAELVHRTGKKISDITLVDHGGGIGMLSFLAKIAGVRSIIYQDINPTIAEDAKVIAKEMNLTIDHFVLGEADDLLNYTLLNKLKVDILGSRNVIEHVADMNDFFASSAKLPADKLVLYLSTSANMRNPLVNWITRRFHRIYEYKGVPSEWGGKKYDPFFSGIKTRERLIKAEFPDLSDKVLNRLSVLSRGKLRTRFIAEVKVFKETGKWPVPIKDRSNTCDPINGGWTENLIPIKDYRKMAVNNGFEFDFRSGFYNTNYSQKILNLITPILNFKIRILGRSGLFLAPFVSIIAEKKN